MRPRSQREDERLISSWERFSEFIKYKRRYFFFENNQEDELLAPHEYVSATDLLGFIGKTVKTMDLVKTLSAGSLVYRARQQKAGERLYTSYDFAQPPVNKAVRSNRMSPAGVVMFYGSDNTKTAQLEIDDDPRLGIAVGTFRTMRDATVLDLTKLPRPLGFFERQSDSSEINRYALAFLHSFVKSVATKVEPRSREHVDYVPTQVVTEWFRTVFRWGKSSLDGIFYPSTQHPGGRSVVLFANRNDLLLTEAELKAAVIEEKTEEWMVRSDHKRSWLKLVRRKVLRDAA